MHYKDSPVLPTPVPADGGPRGKIVTLSVKKRMLLHRLLHRDLRKCSTSSLEACQRAGWTLGFNADYELTAHGRRVAELSEQTPAVRKLELEIS